ncbi:hypothetical protein ACJMK2_008311 [Sinanodonta woodiana]|uniref:Uncharacterized protein n=1 Tax=Sinanodonta woodiana TaxID=1069815 RepID=A0ABD3VL79_SINWO
MEKTSIQTSTELAISATNSIFANELSTTVPTHIILQSVSTMQMNTVNRSILLEPFTTTVVNGETTLTSITLTKPEIPKINSSGGHVQLSTQRTNSHVKDTVSLPTSSLKTQLHGGTTQYNTSLSLAYLSTKEGYNALSTEPDRRLRSQQTTHIIRRSTSMSNAVPTSKQLPANKTYLPSDTMEHTSQRPANMKSLPSDTMEHTSQRPAKTTSLPSDTMEHTSQRPANTTSLLSNTMEPTSKRPAHSFTSIVGGNTSYVQNISARTFSFPSGSIQNRTLPVSTPSYYDSATTIYKLVMGQSNIVLSSQQDASKGNITILLFFICRD